MKVHHVTHPVRSRAEGWTCIDSLGDTARHDILHRTYVVLGAMTGTPSNLASTIFTRTPHWMNTRDVRDPLQALFRVYRKRTVTRHARPHKITQIGRMCPHTAWRPHGRAPRKSEHSWRGTTDI